MGRIEKTVFISYRRTNFSWAMAIYQDLTKQGHDVFIDYLSIASGDFEKIIVQNIKSRAHFVVVLTPSALERCNEPGDWLRREIETAIDERRNIVPLMLEGFDFGSPDVVKVMTGKLAMLMKYNGLPIYSEYFEAGMERLRTRYLNIALDAVIHPISNDVKKFTEAQQLAASKAKQVEPRELTAQGWYEQGKRLAHEDQLENAIAAFEKATDLDSALAEAWENKAQLYIKLGRKNEASESLIRSIESYEKQSEKAQQESGKGYWISQAHSDRLFGKLTDGMADYYDNEVRAESREDQQVDSELTDKIRMLRSLLRKIQES